MAKKHGKMWKRIAAGVLTPDQARQVMAQKGLNKLTAKINSMITEYQSKIPQMVQDYGKALNDAIQHYSILGFAQGIVNNYSMALRTYAEPDYRQASSTMGQKYAGAAPEIPRKWATYWAATMFGTAAAAGGGTPTA
mgnify:FL=1